MINRRQLPLRHFRRLSRLGVATLAMLLAFAGTAAPVGAWANGPNAGNGYGTHDWILDQAFRLLDKRGFDTSWVDRTTALLATDDPDYIEVAADPSRSIEHTYTGGGKRGGAVDRITEHYAAIVRAYKAGDYEAASYNLGMLAHFYGDILQPYHTSRDAIGKTSTHYAYEVNNVDKITKTPTSGAGWSVANTTWVVKDMTNVRSAALAAAAYSRARYLSLAAHFSASNTSLSSTANTVTKEVLVRASGDLANLISSVPKGIGNPPAVGSVSIKLTWRGVKTNETRERIDGTVKDVNGKPIEGVVVNVTWPLANGTTTKLRFWTDQNGQGHVYGTVGAPPYMQHQTVTATVTTNGTTITKTAWFYRTPKLATGTAGFKTTVSDTTVKAGQTVTATTLVRTVAGSPVAGLWVAFTWTLGSTVVTGGGYTDATGRARSTYVIKTTTSHATLTVKGAATSYSISRSSSASFHRVD